VAAFENDKKICIQVKKDGRGRHGNQGRKPKEDPRTNNVNIRLNDAEKEDFDEVCILLDMSQANTLNYLVDIYLTGFNNK